MSSKSIGCIPVEDSSSFLSAIMPELIEDKDFDTELIEEAEENFSIEDSADFTSSECSSHLSLDFLDFGDFKIRLLKAVFYSDAYKISTLLAAAQEYIPLEIVLDVLDSVCRKPYENNLFQPFQENGVFSKLDEIQKSRLFNVCINTDNGTAFVELLNFIRPENMDMLFLKIVNCQAFEILAKFVQTPFFSEISDENFRSSLKLLVLDMAAKNERMDKFVLFDFLAVSSKKETFKKVLKEDEKLRKDLLEKAVIFNNLPLANRLAGYVYSYENAQKLFHTAIRCKESRIYLGLLLKSFPPETINKTKLLVYIAENIEDLEVAEDLKNMVRALI